MSRVQPKDVHSETTETDDRWFGPHGQGGRKAWCLELDGLESWTISQHCALGSGPKGLIYGVEGSPQ